MAERKNTSFARAGGYAMPKRHPGAAAGGAGAPSGGRPALRGSPPGASAHPRAPHPATRGAEAGHALYLGDCRDVLPRLPDRGTVDLVFADPPFNWEVPYEGWKDGMPRDAYERFTFDWLDGCVEALARTVPSG